MPEDFDVKQWLASRKQAGLTIDPETAEVCWIYAQTMDPYGVYSDLPEECQQVGREYFARSPESDIWVNFRDLPDETRDTLWEKHKSQLAFPAGLEDLLQQMAASRTKAPGTQTRADVLGVAARQSDDRT